VIGINDVEFDLLRGYLCETCGIAVPPEKRYLFATRLTPLLDSTGCKSFSDFFNLLRTDGSLALRTRLVEAMTTNETSFFRDGHPFEALRRHVLPEVAGRRRRETRYTPLRIRVLCAGCSTGEEAYSVGICFMEWQAEQSDRAFAMNNLSVVATDISRAVLDRARQGVYDPSRLRAQLPPNLVSTYFVPTHQGFRVRPDLQALITFSQHNLAEPLEGLGCFDIILCRNVIIYFSPELKRSILAQFHRMLLPGGALLLGASESLYQLSDSFQQRHVGATILYFKNG
jgi:chemotaxis protein methyltransferase CheR